MSKCLLKIQGHPARTLAISLAAKNFHKNHVTQGIPYIVINYIYSFPGVVYSMFKAHWLKLLTDNTLTMTHNLPTQRIIHLHSSSINLYRITWHIVTQQYRSPLSRQNTKMQWYFIKCFSKENLRDSEIFLLNLLRYFFCYFPFYVRDQSIYNFKKNVEFI